MSAFGSIHVYLIIFIFFVLSIQCCFCLVDWCFGFLTMNQVGTVVESASDFFTGRLTKKERTAILADELLSDRSLGDYR